jgi:hypothetical protein
MGRANPSELVSSEVALTSATMQKASIAQAPMNCCPQLAASSRAASVQATQHSRKPRI